jgi:hypothetical protein
MRSQTLNVLSSECAEDFALMLVGIEKSAEPETFEEALLVKDIAGLWWKLGRLVRVESNSFSLFPVSDSEYSATMRLLRRYEASMSKQLSVRIRRWVQLRGKRSQILEM